MSRNTLTAQDKLALALTSAGSMRELARRMGVNHQKVDRWLREGEAGGVKKIPGDAFTQKGIDAVYAQHKREVLRQAKRDNVPVLRDAPVYLERKPMRSGKPGMRAVAAKTQFIKPELRERVMREAADSGRIESASVRSVVTLRSYFRRVAAEKHARGQSLGTSVGRLGNRIMDKFIDRENRYRTEPINPDMPFALYTKREGLSRGERSEAIERKLARKHAPSTREPGTVLGDEYLFALREDEDDDEDEDDEQDE